MTANIDDALAASLKRCEKIAEEAREKRRALEAWASGQPQTKACPEHPHIILRIDFDASSRATWRSAEKNPSPGNCDNFKLVYSRCPECAAQDRLATQSHWLKSHGVPENLLHGSFESFRVESESDRANLAKAKQFSGAGKGFLIMHGNRGDGKSLLAVAVLRSLGGGKFMKHNDMLFELRRSYSEKNVPNVIRLAKAARCLVLDELGLSLGGADELPMLHSVLDHRYGEKLPTVITANLTREKINESVGARMADRLTECCFAWLDFNGPSSRPAERTKYFG